jgi:MFS family permease
VISTQVSVALGPSLGGLLVGAFGWQAVFLANVPLVVIGSVLALLALQAGRALRDAHLLAPAGPARDGRVRRGNDANSWPRSMHC